MCRCKATAISLWYVIDSERLSIAMLHRVVARALAFYWDIPRRMAFTIAASSGTTLFAAGQGPKSTAAGHIWANVPSAVLAAACQYFGFCC
jgi:hypothetical protein